MVKEKEQKIDIQFNSLDEETPYDKDCFKKTLISMYVEGNSRSAEDFLDNYYNKAVSIQWSDIFTN